MTVHFHYATEPLEVQAYILMPTGRKVVIRKLRQAPPVDARVILQHNILSDVVFQ